MNRLLAAVLFLVAFASYSQSQVRFDRITVEDGLSQSAIKSMVQDQYGYLWIGTLDGLNKYDGSKFYVYQYDKNSPKSIPRNDIHKLFIDAKQNLWVSTAGYLSRFVQETNNFVHYPVVTHAKPNPGFIVNDLYQDSDSILVLATNSGVWQFNVTTGSIARNELFAEFDTEEVRDYSVAKDGSTWLATTHAVYLKNKDDQIFTKVIGFQRRIEFYYSHRTNEIYLQTRDELFKFDFDSGQFISIHTFSRLVEVDESHMRLLKLGNGELWVMRRELLIFDSTDHPCKTLHYIKHDPFSLSSDYLACLYETKDGVVWIGTNGMGLNKYSPQLSVFNYFGNFSGAPISLSNNFVTAMATADDNLLYVATTEGLDIINLRLANTKHYALTSINGRKSRINKLTLAANGDLWIATSKGLQKWNGKELQFSGVPQLDNPATTVNDLLFLSDHELLIATTTEIALLNTLTKKITPWVPQGTLTMNVMNQKLWTERFEHILQYDLRAHLLIQDTRNDPRDSSSFPDATIKCFYQDTEGKIWIGSSGGGISLYDATSNTFQNFNERQGLPNSVVYGMLEDKAGHLWLSTNKGISVFSKRELRSIRNYNATHGLQGNEFNTNAYFKSPSGKMYFGGVNGLTAFYPEQALALESEVPKCIITGLYMNGERKEQTSNQQLLGQIIQDKLINLAWSERNFGFEISSLGFSYPAHTSYKYILQGYQDAWTFLENERRIQFTNIPPGNYVLRVKSSNSFGEWEAEGLAIVVNIKPPVWRRAWFILLVSSFIILLLYAIFQWRTRALRKQKLLLEWLVAERTKTLQIQQEEIASQNEELIAQAETVDHRNAELEKIKSSLEKRVEKRTNALQKLNEELLDQNSQLEQFAFITAHNIRGPVARIKGLLNLLHAGDDKRVVLGFLETSVNNLDEVIADLNAVLNIRKSTGNTSEQIDLKAQLDLTISMLEDEISKAGGTIDTRNFQPVAIVGLRPYIHSIFYNLIHNALKYSSHERSIHISCSTSKHADRVQIIVEDNGMGIDMRYAKGKIFNLYQRFHPEVPGKGFGLFLTKTQVEAMSGTISVESTLNAGTRFTIEFPIN